MLDTVPWFAFPFITIVAVLVLLGIWERLVRIRARSWPVAQGSIESIKVEAGGRRRRRWYARLYYSFSVQDRNYRGRYSQDFPWQDDAEEWLRDLQGKPVPVHYSSRFPALSVITNDDLRMLLATRGPEPEVPGVTLAPGLTSSPAPRLRGWQRALGQVLMFVASFGFLLSLKIHFSAWLGAKTPSDHFQAVLNVLCFSTFVVTVLIVPKTRRRSESPQVRPVLVWLAVVVLIYGIANFVFWMIVSANHHGHLTASQEVRFFSGHWMMFFLWQVVFLEPVVGRGSSHR